MKALYFSIFYMLFVFVAFSQEQESRFTKIKSATTEYENVSPDEKFHWTTYDEPEWNTTESKYFRFYNLSSGMYAIHSREGSCEVYKFNGEKFHYQDIVHEGNSGKDYDPKYPPLMFEYAGNVYVFEYGQSVSDLHFVQHHTDNIVDWDDNTWHKDHDLNEHDDDFRIYRAACNINDTLYMVYDQTDDSQDNGVGDGCEIRIAQCTMNDKHELVQHQLFKLEDVMKLGGSDEDKYHPMAATSFVHPDGLPRMIISFSGADDGVDSNENYGGGVFVFNPQTGEVEDWLYSNADYAMDVRAVFGSMQAGRDFAKGGTLNGNRIQVFYTHFGNDGDDYGHFHCKTIMITNEGKYEQAGEKLIAISLGDEDYYPHDWYHMNLDVAYFLKAETDNSLDDVTVHSKAGTKYFQRIWMFYTDRNGHVRGCGFHSDIWQYVHGSYTYSSNLDEVDTYAQKGVDVKKYWKLFGIVEGAPPVAIDWERWKEMDPEKKPSSFIYKTELEEETTVTSTEKSSFFVGFKIGGDEPGEGKDIGTPIQADFKYTHAWEKENENSYVKITGAEHTIKLSEEGQKLGVLFYLVPNYERLTYATYPWWVEYDDRNEENAFSTQYRLINLGYNIHKEFISLDDSIFGFDISKMNDPDMSVWKNRAWVDQYSPQASWNPTLEWSNRGSNDATIFLTEETGESVKNTIENEIEFSAEVGVPDVFRAQGGFSHSWSNSVEVTTTVSKTMSFSYENLEPEYTTIFPDSVKGNLTTTVLLFKEPQPGFLYSKFLEEGQKPWYIAYSVNIDTTEIGIEEPTSILETADKDIVFNIYPSPNDGRILYLKISQPGLQNYQLKVLNSCGIEVYNSQITLSGEGKSYPVTFENMLTSGMYLVQIIADKSNIAHVGKFVVR